MPFLSQGFTQISNKGKSEVGRDVAEEELLYDYDMIWPGARKYTQCCRYGEDRPFSPPSK